MKPIQHINDALAGLEERGMKYNSIWDSLIACKDDLVEAELRLTELQAKVRPSVEAIEVVAESYINNKHEVELFAQVIHSMMPSCSNIITINALDGIIKKYEYEWANSNEEQRYKMTVNNSLAQAIHKAIYEQDEI